MTDAQLESLAIKYQDMVRRFDRYIHQKLCDKGGQSFVAGASPDQLDLVDWIVDDEYEEDLMLDEAVDESSENDSEENRTLNACFLIARWSIRRNSPTTFMATAAP